MLKTGPKGEDRIEGVARITREQIERWNQMTALRFQTWGDIRNVQASRQAKKKPGGF